MVVGNIDEYSFEGLVLTKKKMKWIRKEIENKKKFDVIKVEYGVAGSGGGVAGGRNDLVNA